jgi:hypothetical protein
MEFYSLQFVLWPDDGSYEPKLTAKKLFLKRSVRSDFRINKNKYTLEFSQEILEKSSNIKFYENTSSRNRVVPCGRTDRQT